MEEKTYLIALSVMRHGAVREYFQVKDNVSPREFYEAIPFYERCRVASHIAAEYQGMPLDVASEILLRADARNIGTILFGEDSYPDLLSEIPDPPLVLYCMGAVPSGEMVSIVGTRESSREADAAAYRLAQDFASAGITVVSGMARGIDRAAHRGALDANSPTVGVLAHGIDKRYPAANSDLFDRIALSPDSSLVSEYPPGVQAGAWTFARRNRIISGLSRAVAVVQAGLKSGAMITARYAAEQGRDIFAVGGLPYDESFEGCRSLIRDGGSIVGSASDICPGQRILPGFSAPSAAVEAGGEKPALPSGLSQEEEKIIALVDAEGKDIDEIIRVSGLPPFVVATAVVSLELSGLVVRSGSAVIRKR